MANVFVEEKYLQDIADAIREKNGTETKYPPSEMSDAVRAIENSGNTSFELARSIQDAFRDSTFPSRTEIILKINQTDGKLYSNCCCYTFYRTSGIKSIKMSCRDKETPINYSMFAQNCTDLEEVDLSDFNRNFSNSSYMFTYCKKLRKIIGELDFSTLAADGWGPFVGCESLEEIRFKEKCLLKYNISFSKSALLSDESIQSIIEALGDLTGATALKLVLHSTVVSKLTEEQVAQIANKNWVIG